MEWMTIWAANLTRHNHNLFMRVVKSLCKLMT